MKRLISVATAIIMLLTAFGLVSYADIYAGDSNMAIESIEVQNSNTLIINWNVMADNVYDSGKTRTDIMCGVISVASVCITDDEYNIQYFNGIPLQWAGIMDYPLGWTMANVMSFKVATTLLGVSDLSGIIRLTEKGNSFEGLKVCFCLEEGGTAIPGDGIVQCYFESGKYDWESINGVNWCLATKPAEEGVFDRVMFMIGEEKPTQETTADVTTAPGETTVSDETTFSEETDKPDETTVPAEEEKDDTKNLLIIIAACATAVLSAAVIIAAVILSKKKKVIYY